MVCSPSFEYRNYLDERWGGFSGFSTFQKERLFQRSTNVSWGACQKNAKQVLVSISFSRLKLKDRKMKKENTISLIQKSLQHVLLNFLIVKNKGDLTADNSCFVILANYLNERLCRNCKFPNECPFLGLRGGGCSFKPGHSLNFSAVKKGAHSKGAFIQAGVLFQIITVCT